MSSENLKLSDNDARQSPSKTRGTLDDLLSADSLSDEFCGVLCAHLMKFVTCYVEKLLILLVYKNKSKINRQWNV